MKNKLFSFEVSFIRKPRGKKGEGRATIYKPVNLPKETLEKLRLIKSLYEEHYSEKKDESGNPIPVKLSYGQILEHWFEHLDAIDPEIAESYQFLLSKHPELHYVDPTEGEVWEQEYIFTNIDGDEYPAILDEDAKEFFADYKGIKVSVANMALNDFDFQNDAGIDISVEQAKIIAERIVEHNAAEE